jgi:hypothetical protein
MDACVAALRWHTGLIRQRSQCSLCSGALVIRTLEKNSLHGKIDDGQGKQSQSTAIASKQPMTLPAFGSHCHWPLLSSASLAAGSACCRSKRPGFACRRPRSPVAWLAFGSACCRHRSALALIALGSTMDSDRLWHCCPLAPMALGTAAVWLCSLLAPITLGSACLWLHLPCAPFAFGSACLRL